MNVCLLDHIDSTSNPRYNCTMTNKHSFRRPCRPGRVHDACNIFWRWWGLLLQWVLSAKIEEFIPCIHKHAVLSDSIHIFLLYIRPDAHNPTNSILDCWTDCSKLTQFVLMNDSNLQLRVLCDVLNRRLSERIIHRDDSGIHLIARPNSQHPFDAVHRPYPNLCPSLDSFVGQSTGNSLCQIIRLFVCIECILLCLALDIQRSPPKTFPFPKRLGSICKKLVHGFEPSHCRRKAIGTTFISVHWTLTGFTITSLPCWFYFDSNWSNGFEHLFLAFGRHICVSHVWISKTQ
mmetsp:Transcript_8173/g.16389  ORF Transcript_8173/g.16389 Transcript_8173/m.16389 type:complete len:290 (+) Transcript_8173:1580-2449(+)